MDYRLNGSVSVREVYEFKNTVSPLSETMLGNQIGINGLIFTRDGYLLIEKRGRKKTTWKDKFAQPISLAMKESDLRLDEAGKLGGTPEAAEENFRKIVLTTIGKNFGISEEDILPFRAENNFFGIARDLLEGGKPNFYFYVVTKRNAAELAEFLEDKARRAAEKCGAPGEVLPKLSQDKLDNAFYLVKYDDIRVDFGYDLKLCARSVYRIRRKFFPLASVAAQAFDGLGFRFRRAFGGKVEKECGEALLACLSFAHICRDRLKKEIALDGGENNGEK